ncbi:MAG: hypothetical protein WC623_24480 [Pedobacter sp.]|uniref:hypothetical protein n=1 Tax=Pedobacter sp. TaxID=1411316 RepID=UPI0035621CC5
MAETLRQQILDKVKARLQTILVANGYSSNLGSSVFEWRVEPFATSELPALVYRDPSDDISQAEGHRNHLTLEIEIVTASETISAVRKKIADVILAIGTDTQWDGLAIDTIPGNDEIIIDQKDKTISGVSMRFTVFFRTKEWKPYTPLV